MARKLRDSTDRTHSVGAAELSDSLSIPHQYLQQILQRLRKGGLIESVRGPGGGYRLAHDPTTITLKDILQAAEGDTFEIVCDSKGVFHECAGPTFSCSLKPVWHELKEAVDALLSSKTLAALAETSTPDFGRELIALTRRPSSLST